MRKWSWIVAVALIVAVGAFWAWAHRSSTEPAATSSAPSVQTATVRYGEYAIELTETGSVGAPAGATTQLAFPLPGTVGAVYVRVGEHVRAGQVVATLDTRTLSLTAQQAAADAQAASAQARAAAVDRFSTKLAVDRAAVAREERLYAAGVAARKDIEAARAQLAADEADATAAGSDRAAAAAQAQSAAVKAQLATTDLARASLRAPLDGVITAILHKTGESVDASTPVLTIGPASQAEATLQVPSSDAAQIATGDPVSISVTGTATRSAGRVSAVVPAVDPATQAATVVVSGVPSSAVAGTAISATITVGHTRGLLIPSSAVVQDPQSGENVVFVLAKQKDGTSKFESRTVTVVHEDNTTAEVSGELHAGDRIAARGAFELLAPADANND